MATATKAASAKATPTAPKRVVAGPSFALKPIGEELPDNPARSRTVNREELIANLTTIMDTPNTWFEIAAYAARPGSAEKPGGARKAVDAFLNGRIVPPKGDGEFDLEWRAANYDGSDRKGSVVCARYILEDGAAE